MGKGSSAPKPDQNIGLAALEQARLGRDWMAIAKEQFAVENKRNDRMADLAGQVTAEQLAASRTAQQWAAEDRARYRSIFQPMQDELVETAANWDSKERQDKLAAEARAGVINAATDQADQRERRMASMGIDPTSGRYAGVEREADTNTALAAAGAQNNARNQVRKEAVALKADAVNMGNGLPSSAAGSLGLGVSAGSAAVGTTAASNDAYSRSVGTLRDGYTTAMAGYGAQAQTLSSLYNGQLQAWQANQNSGGGLMGTIGSVAGAIISSKELKEDKQPARGVLEALREMPVEEWSYKDGVADGERHIGPYAEDFHKATGKGDGKVIPVVDALGVTMGAVQELDRKVQKLVDARDSRRGMGIGTAAQRGGRSRGRVSAPEQRKAA